MYIGRHASIQILHRMSLADITGSPSQIPRNTTDLFRHAANSTLSSTSSTSIRPDLVLHDLYSFSLGIFLLLLVVKPVVTIWRMRRGGLERRGAIRRGQGRGRGRRGRAGEAEMDDQGAANLNADINIIAEIGMEDFARGALAWWRAQGRDFALMVTFIPLSSPIGHIY